MPNSLIKLANSLLGALALISIDIRMGWTIIPAISEQNQGVQFIPFLYIGAKHMMPAMTICCSWWV